MRRGRLSRLALGFVGLTSAATLVLASSATAALQVNPDPVTLARAIVADPGVVTGASYVARPPFGSPVALAGDALGSFPTGGSDYAILTTGNALLAPTANNSGSSGADNGGQSIRGNTDYDVVVLRIDLNVPATANCLVGMDFRFYSDEYPEYVGSSYNDAFIAELDRTTWTTAGSAISAPDNFAFDPSGEPITVNAAGVTSMTAADAAGTTYDGATPLLTAATPITPGPHSLFFSIFDQGDRIYDSAVFIDNLRFGTRPATECRPGADIAGGHNVFVGLGDSYSSGFGMAPYPYSPTNDCQRSASAFAPVLAGGLPQVTLDFHACQGGVTQDFYRARFDEQPQLDYLNENTGLVTFSVGGNDAHFADVLAECILGFELLPFNTCHNDDKVTKPIAEAFARLDGQTSIPVETVPYDTLLKDVRARTPYAARVQIGYPPFFTASGSDRTFLPGGRCEGVKKADQRWMVEKMAELNAIIRRNALRNGFLFVDPTGSFAGHELCSGDSEWFFPLLSAGKYHPTVPGHSAIASLITGALAADDSLERFIVGPSETRIYRFDATGGLVLLSVIIEWPGSDVVLTLTSPSGKVYTRNAPNGAEHGVGPTWEQLEIPTPEAGQWTVRMFGADVKPAGEPVTVRVFQEKPANKRPVGAIDLRRVGDTLVLDGSRSRDPDGTIVSFDWYVATGTEDTVHQGERVSIPLSSEPRTITLVATDNGGLTDFVTVSTVPLDIKPESGENPLNPKSKGVVPVALLSSATFDATTIASSTLRLGPRGAAVQPPHVHLEDVNGDGLVDLLLQFQNQEIGLAAGMTTLCLTGTLPDARTFSACDAIRLVP